MYICSLQLLYFHFHTNYAWRRVRAHVIFKRCFQSSLSLKSFEGSLSNWWLCRSKTVTCSECWLNILRHFLYYIWCFFFYFLKMFPLSLVFSLDSLAAVNYTLNIAQWKRVCTCMDMCVCVCVLMWSVAISTQIICCTNIEHLSTKGGVQQQRLECTHAQAQM